MVDSTKHKPPGRKRKFLGAGSFVGLFICGLVTWHYFDVVKPVSEMKTCQQNLTKIDGAKEQWSLEN